MRRLHPHRALLAVLLPFAVGCHSASASAPETVVVTGSSTIAPLMAEIGRRFEELNPAVRVEVQAGGSSRGLADARRGLAAIGMVSRSPAEGEDDIQWHPVARDGIALVVHADNPIAELTDAQVVAIFSGAVESWSEVGGPPSPITVVNKAAGRSTLEVFTHHFGLAPERIRADVVIGDNQQGLKTVAGNRWAIAYISIGTAVIEIERGAPIRVLASRGVEASVATVADGRYPIVRTLHLVTHGELDPLAAELVDFARSPAVHDLITAQAFVPITGS